MSNLTAKFSEWRKQGAKPSKQQTKPAPLSLARPGRMGFPNGSAPFGCVATKRHQAKFVEAPDPKPLPVPRCKHTLKVSPLTKIGEQLQRGRLALPRLGSDGDTDGELRRVDGRNL